MAKDIRSTAATATPKRLQWVLKIRLRVSESRIGVIPGNPDGHALRLDGDALALRSPEQAQELLERLDRVREPWIRIRDMNAI